MMNMLKQIGWQGAAIFAAGAGIGAGARPMYRWVKGQRVLVITKAQFNKLSPAKKAKIKELAEELGIG